MRRESRRFAVGVLRVLEAVVRFVFLLIAVACIIVTFFVLNNTIITGRENIGKLRRLTRATGRGAFIGSTHYTMLDSWVLLFSLGFPGFLWNIRRLPWSLPDRANYFSVPGVSHVVKLYHTIPVERTTNARKTDDRTNIGMVRFVRELIRRGEIVQVFYQGGRTPDDSLGIPKPKIMEMILRMDAHVLPVLLLGTRAVQPYRKNPGDPPATLWRYIPKVGKRLEWLFHARFGKRIMIFIGDPWPASEIVAELASVPETERVARFCALFMERMEALRRQAEGLPQLKEAS